MLYTKPLEPKEYLAWCENEEHGLRASADAPQARYTLQYRPSEYSVLRQMHISPQNKEAFKAAQEQLDPNGDHYTLTIRGSSQAEPMREGLADATSYFERTAYYSLDFERDLVMTQGRDTLQCLFAHTERSFGISPDLNIVLVFPKADPSGSPTCLHVNDRALGNVNVELKLDPAVRSRVPALANL